MLKSKINKNNILDNWKFEFINARKTYNITKEIKKFIDEDEFLNLSENFNYGNFINKKNNEIKKGYLKITNPYNKNWSAVTINSSSPLRIYLGDKKNNLNNLEIVYFFNAEISPCYLNLLKDQLKDLIKSNILIKYKVKIYCVIVCENKKKKSRINNLFNNLNLTKHCELKIYYKKNIYKEYEGIYKVWSISQVKDSNLVLYFHGKGISYLTNRFIYLRQPIEKLIFRILIGKLKKNLEIIYRIKSISKVGILSGGNGWLWFNFWIAKKSYLSRVKKPIMTNRACYYEDWLGRLEIDKDKNYQNIYKNEYGDLHPYSLNETFSILSSPKNKKYNIGSFCKVEKGGFVGLGITKYKYKLWYFFLVILNKFKIIKGTKDRFQFF